MKNKKRMLVRLLCLVGVLFSLCLLNACGNGETPADSDCEHIWSEWDTLQEATCTEEGAQRWHCSKCDVVDTRLVPAFGHSWGEWSVKTPSTCTAMGEETRVCSYDSTHVESRQIVPVGHTYNQQVVNETYLKSPATCSAKATYYLSCTCGKHAVGEGAGTFEVGELLAHTFDEGKVTLEATHLTEGTKTYTCTVCGSTVPEILSKTDEHLFGAAVKMNEYQHEMTCPCGEKLLVNHTWNSGLIVNWATHTTVGSTVYTCTDCGAIKSELLDKTTGHSFDQWQPHNEAQHKLVCSCGEIEYADHVWDTGRVTVVATHTTEGVAMYICTVCHAVKSETVPKTTEHRFGTWEKVDDNTHKRTCVCGEIETAAHGWNEGTVVTEATHLTEGSKRYTCTDCSAVKTEALPKNEAHSFGVWTASGDSHTRSCACGETETAAHNYDTIYERVFATDEGPGYVIKKCSACGDIGDPETLNHNYAAGTPVAATCQIAGYTEYTCTECGDTYRDDVTELAAHTFGSEAYRTVAPTCLAGGYDEYQCTVCGLMERRNAANALGHNTEGGIQVLTAASCEQRGRQAVSCQREGCTYGYEEDIPALGHTDTKGEEVAATCTADAYTIYGCDRCDYVYTILEEGTKKSHNLAKSETKDATCMADGYIKQTCANNCGYQDTTILPKLDHQMTTATCTEASVCSYNCGTLGDPATGHSYTSEETKAATCTDKGVMTYTCGCGDHYESEIEATGHTVAEGTTWESTTEKISSNPCVYMVHETAPCKNCEATVTRDTDSYQGCSYTTVITKTATCQAAGEKTTRCKDCGYVPEGGVTPYDDANAHHFSEIPAGASGKQTQTCTVQGCNASKEVWVGATQGDTTSLDGSYFDENVNELAVGSTGASITLDEQTKNQLAGEASKEGSTGIDISVGEVGENELNSLIRDPDVLAQIGDSPVYSLTMQNGEGEDSFIRQFDGRITVRLPYELGAEDPDDLVIWYINDEGEPSSVSATYVVIDGKGYAEFSTDHFSYYTVTRMSPAERCAKEGYHPTKVVSQAAGCLIGGYSYEICTRCGAIFNEVKTPANGHDWVTAVESAVSCTTDGRIRYTCDVCHITYTENEKALGHSMTKPLATEAASCLAAGYERYGCSREGCEATHEKTLARLRHSYVGTPTAATCTTDGFTLYACSNEGCTESYVGSVIFATGHEKVSEEIPATCIADGYVKHWCTVCGEKFANTPGESKTAHLWNVAEPTCVTGQICTECGTAGAQATGEHTYENGVCTVCQTECAHAFYRGQLVEATCNAGGYTEYICNYCGMTERREQIPAREHDWKEFGYKAPTCNESGFYESFCPYCNSHEREELAPDAAFHDIVTVRVAVTCTEDGYVSHFCRICQTELERTDSVPATGHDYRPTETLAATCTASGSERYVCGRCGEEHVNELPALGHTYENGACIRCGTPEGAACTHVSLSDCEIQATPIFEMGKTCDDGIKIVYTCTLCGEAIKTEYTNDHVLEALNTVDLTALGCACENAVAYRLGCRFCDYETVEFESACAFRSSGSMDSNGSFTTKYVCVKCGFSYSMRQEIVEQDDCHRTLKVEYSLGNTGEIFGFLVGFTDGQHDYDYQMETVTTEGTDEAGNPIQTKTISGLGICKTCGLTVCYEEYVEIFDQYGNTLREYGAEYLPLNADGSEHQLLTDGLSKYEYAQTADGELVIVGFYGCEIFYNPDGSISEKEEGSGRATLNGEELFEEYLRYVGVDGELVLIAKETREAVEVTMPNGQTRVLTARTVENEYRKDGSVIRAYEETYTYEVIPGENCKLNVSYRNSDGEARDYVEEAHGDTVESFVFNNGGSNCIDGVTVTERCTVCDQVVSEETYSYHVTNGESIRISDWGYACDTTVYVGQCTRCDYQEVYIYGDCAFEQQGNNIFKPDADSDGNIGGGITITPIGNLTYTCEKCGFCYTTEQTTTETDGCRVITTTEYRLGVDEDGTAKQVVTALRYSAAHLVSDVSETLESTEIDGAGNTLTVKTEKHRSVCRSCGVLLNQQEYITKRTEAGDLIWEASRWYNVSGDEATLNNEELREWIVVTDANGDTRRVVSRVKNSYFYSNGELGGTDRVYSYENGDYCHATVTVTELDGGLTYTEQSETHNTQSAIELLPDSASCSDGLLKKEVCVYCDTVVSEQTVYKHMTDLIIIEPTELGYPCMGNIEIVTCPCGENSYINFNLKYRSEVKGYEDTEGISHRVITYSCMDCSFKFSVDEWSEQGEGCQINCYALYRFGIAEDGSAVREIRMKTGVEYEHVLSTEKLLNETATEVDEAGRTLTVYTVESRTTCETCGTVTDHSRSITKTDAEGNQLERSIRTYAVDETGESYPASESLERYELLVTQSGKTVRYPVYAENCIYNIDGEWIDGFITEYQYQGDNYCHATVMARYPDGSGSSSTYDEHIDQHTTMTLVEGAESCEDGVWLVDACGACGTIFSEKTIYEHRRNLNSYPLSDFGAFCDGYVWVDVCSCEQKFTVDVMSECIFEGREEVEEIDGVTYYTTINTCGKCGFAYTVKTWSESIKEICGTVDYTEYGIAPNGNGVPAKTYTFRRIGGSQHSYDFKVLTETTAEELNEFGDTLTVIERKTANQCIRCGHISGVNYDVEKLLDGNTVYLYQNFFWVENGEEVPSNDQTWNYIAVRLPEGDTRYVIAEYRYRSFNALGETTSGYDTVYTYGENDYCHATVTNTDSQGVITTEERTFHIGQNIYRGELSEGATSCKDGLTVYTDCSACGEVKSSREVYYHRTFTEEMDLTQYGSTCGNNRAELTSCPCGLERSLYVYGSYEMHMDTSMNEDGHERTLRTYSCTECGFVYTLEDYKSMDGNCKVTAYEIYGFGTDGKGTPLYAVTFIRDGGTSHDGKATELDCQTTAEIDGQGRELTVTEVETETFCRRCGEKLIHQRKIQKTTAKGELLYEATVFYDSESGVMTDRETYVYDLVTLTGGKTHQILLSYTHTFYDENGTVTAEPKQIYTYGEDSYCVYTIAYYNEMGELERTEQHESHGSSQESGSLLEGSLTCKDGVLISVRCLDCGTVIRSYESYGHSYFTREYELSDYGSECGGIFRVSGCPCGEISNQYVYNNCSFTQQQVIDTSESGARRVVTTYTCRNCSFVYTLTTWTVNGEFCRTTTYALYTFGQGENALSIECIQSSLAKHDYQSKSESEETTEETEQGTLRVVTTDRITECAACGMLLDRSGAVEKYNEQNVQVYLRKISYTFSQDATDGMYVSGEDEMTWGVCQLADGSYERYRLTQTQVRYKINGEESGRDHWTYAYTDGDYCQATVTYTYSYGSSSSYSEMKHLKTESKIVLSEDSETCTDGLDYVEYCVVCEATLYRNTGWSWSHEIQEKNPVQTIDLAQYGCVCGGTAYVYACPCGMEQSVTIQSDCHFGKNEYPYATGTSEGTVYGMQYICSVTDPALCGFRYAHVEWNASDEFCMGYSYEYYLFGLDANGENPVFVLDLSYKTGELRHQFRGETTIEQTQDGKTVETYTLICNNCSLLQGKEISTSYVEADTGYFVIETEVISYDTSSAENAEVGRKETVEKYLEQTKNGGSRSVPIYLYAAYYNTKELYDWTKSVYTYENGEYCVGTYTLTNMSGKYDGTFPVDNHLMRQGDWIQENTCTQSGSSYFVCRFCNLTETETFNPMRHSYKLDYETGIYTCQRCGLENFTGADGTILLEDLTFRRGDGTKYVVGYYNTGSRQFLISLTLVDADGNEYDLTTAVTDDGTSLLTIDVRAVTAEILAMSEMEGVDACGYMICVRFLPVGGDGYYDYAITLDPHVYVLDEEQSMTTEEPCFESTLLVYTCTLCGDVRKELISADHQIEYYDMLVNDTCVGEKDSHGLHYSMGYCVQCEQYVSFSGYYQCDIEQTDSSYTDENGVFHTVDTFTCQTSGYAYSVDSYWVYDGCWQTRYMIYRMGVKADGSYDTEATITSRSLSHNQTVTDREETSVDEDGNTVIVTTRVFTCQICGKTLRTIVETRVTTAENQLLSLSTVSTNRYGEVTRYEYDYIYIGGMRQISRQQYELVDVNGTVTEGYTQTNTYDLELRLCEWTIVYINGMIHNGSEYF